MSAVAPHTSAHIEIDHAGPAERREGKETRAVLRVSRGLKSGKVDLIPLNTKQLLRLSSDAARCALALHLAEAPALPGRRAA